MCVRACVVFVCARVQCLCVVAHVILLCGIGVSVCCVCVRARELQGWLAIVDESLEGREREGGRERERKRERQRERARESERVSV